MYNILRSAITGILLPVSFAVILLHPGSQKDSVLVETDYPENPVITSTQKAFSLRPNAFEENTGQMLNENGVVDHSVRFRYAGSGKTSIFLLNRGLAYQFKQPVYPEGYLELRSKKQLDEAEQLQFDALKKEVYAQTYQMSILLEGASENASITKEKPLSAIAKYYQHHTGQQAGYFEKVTYQDVYPGIDWVIYTTEHGIKYDFELAPGADPSLIKLRIMDAESIWIDKTGSLVLTNRLGSVTENTPVSFQEGKTISTVFVLDSNLLQFKPGTYDPAKPLTIDPTIIWSTYFGGTQDDWAYGTVVDGGGNVYIAGTTESSSGMASGGFDISLGGTHDAYLAKFNSNGVLQWATYYGGSDEEYGTSCAVDGSNNVYLAGYTYTSTGIGSGGHQTTYGGGTASDAFLVKFNSSGTRQWATYYGGNASDIAYTCCTDASGNVFLGGTTSSTANISTAGAHATVGGGGCSFIAKFNSAGTRQWGTYYGYVFASVGKNTRVNSLCTDGSGNVYAAGYTNQETVIADGGHDNSLGGSNDAFLVKFNSNGTRQWGTYYGYSDGSTYGNACATDGSNNVYLLATTSATRFLATASSHQTAIGGNSDAVLAKFDASGNRTWATFYGGTADDDGNALSIDNNNNVYIAGLTKSASAIADGGQQNTIGGGFSDAFLAKLNSSGERQWATYYGGTNYDVAYGCATGSANNVYICGSTQSTTAIADGGHQNTIGGKADGFLAKFRSIAIGLPVQLTRFEGQCIGTGAELSWQTATEINNKKFVVERSENQQIWSVAGEVAGAGNSNQPRHYQFRDEKAGVGPLRFYRLKQVDFDGKTTLSPVVKIQCNTNSDNALRVYPNPANQGKVFVKGWTEAGRYFLVNTMGQVVKSGQLQDNLPAIEVTGLAPGTYFLNLEGKTQKLREKIILR